MSGQVVDTETGADTRDVYFAQGEDGGPVKIGVARDPAARLAEIQAMSPTRLRMIGVMRGAGQAHETRLHRLFANDRRHGEWFRPSRRLLDYIDVYAARADGEDPPCLALPGIQLPAVIPLAGGETDDLDTHVATWTDLQVGEVVLARAAASGRNDVASAQAKLDEYRQSMRTLRPYMEGTAKTVTEAVREHSEAA